MKKLIDISDQLAADLRVMAALESKGNLNAQIVKTLEKSVAESKHTNFLKNNR